MRHISCGLRANNPRETCQHPSAKRTPAELVGCYKLQSGRAIKLTFQAAGELRIAHGRAWLTFAGAANDATVIAGDHFLNAEQALPFKAGQTIVMEALGTPTEELYFSLFPATQSLVVVNSHAIEPRTVLAWAFECLGHALDVLATKLFGLAQSAHAFGQTGLHPSAKAAQEYQS